MHDHRTEAGKALGDVAAASGASEGTVVPESGAPPVAVSISECTSVIEASISASFVNMSMSAMASEDSAMYKHVVEAQARGLMVLTAFPRMELPQMPGMGGLMAMQAGQPLSMELKTTSITVLTPIPGGTTVTTKCIYVPFTIDASIGFSNAPLQNVTDGVSGTISFEAQQGFRCVGMNLASAGMQGGMGAGSVASRALTELVFQKVHPPDVVTAAWAGGVQYTSTFETCTLQNAAMLDIRMGQMNTTLPDDLLSTLNGMGAQGWEFSGFLALPVAMGGVDPMMMIAGTQLPMPFQMFFYRVPMQCTPVQYRLDWHRYSLDLMAMQQSLLGMGRGESAMRGDPRPLIESHANKGWMLRGALSLPSEAPTPGAMSMQMNMPLLMVFMSNTAVVPWAMPVGDSVALTEAC